MFQQESTILLKLLDQLSVAMTINSKQHSISFNIATYFKQIVLKKKQEERLRLEHLQCLEI